MGDSHATPSPAGNSLDYYRVPDPFGHGDRVLLVFHDPLRTGRRWDARFFCQNSADSLILQRIHCARVGSNKANIAALTNIGKMRIFSQETVTGVNGIHVS